MFNTTHTDTAPRDLLDVATFTTRYPAWTRAALRALIFGARDRLDASGKLIPGNGLAPAIYRVGRRVLISESGFFGWVAAQQQRDPGAKGAEHHIAYRAPEARTARRGWRERESAR